MGRTYAADVKVQEAISKFSGSGDQSFPFVGLIIGQLSSQKDYVVHITKTPILETDSGSANIANNSTQSVKPTSSSKSNSNISSENILEKSICTHARQVKQMLTGGLDIIGIFVLVSLEEFKSASIKYRQLLYNLFKLLIKSSSSHSHISKSDQHHTHRVLLQICPHTKKINCKSFDISDHRNSGSPGEWKFQNILDFFVGFATGYSAKVDIYVPETASPQSLEKQLIISLDSMISNIWNSFTIVEGKLIADETCQVDTLLSLKKNKCNDDVGDELNVELILDLTQTPSSTIRSIKVNRCMAKIMMEGTTACRAYVHSKSTIAEAFLAIKLDIIRSLIARCELVCQDLLQAEEEQEVRIIYETPTRAFTHLHDSPVQLCDYLFQDETANDSLIRFSEVLSLQVSEESLDQSLEYIPESKDLEKAESLYNEKETKDYLVHSTDSKTAFNHAWKRFAFLSGFSLFSIGIGLLSYWYYFL